MKKIQGGTRLLLLIILIIIYSTHGTLLVYQMNTKEYSVSGRTVSPLRKDALKPNRLPETGIVSPSRFPRSPSASIQEIPNDKPIFFPGDELHIKNRFSLPGLEEYAIVQQRIGIYLFDSTDQLSNDSDHQVSVLIPNSDITNGSYAPNPVAISNDPTHGWLNTSFKIPDLTTLGDINIEPGDDVTIYQYYDGNSTADLDGMVIEITDTFSLGGFSKITREDPGFVPNTFRQGEAASVKLIAQSGDDLVPGVDVSWELYYNDTQIKIPNPADIGITVTLSDVTSGNPSVTTDANGELNLTVETMSPDTPEEDYYILITGDFSATTYYTENYDGTAISNHYNSTANFTVSNDIAAFSALAPGFEDFFRGSNTFRHGENATVTLKADDGLDGILGANLTCTLHYKDNGTGIMNGTIGIDFYLRDRTTGSPRATTDANGELNLTVVTSYPSTPEENYSFYVTANFTGTGYNAPLYDGVDESTNYMNLTVNFTVRNEMDYVTLEFFSAVPWANTSVPLEPPKAYFTIITFRAQALYAYGGPTDYYFPGYIPVNATLDTYPENVTLSGADYFQLSGTPGWWWTNATGYIAFNVTAGFPVPFNNSILTITAVANLQNNTAPEYPTIDKPYPHRFLRNSTDGFTASNNRVISIDPDFWVGQIRFDTRNTTSIRPGQAALVEYEVYSDQTSDKLVNVPVKIELNESLPGVTLTFNEGRNPRYDMYGFYGYYYTDSNGIIEVAISIDSIYSPNIINIVLNLTVDFHNDSQDQWIGINNAGNDTINNFNNTWTFTQSTNLTINPEFLIGQITFISSNVTNDRIRPGEAAKLTFEVSNSEQTCDNVPVKFELNQAIAGVSLLNTPLNPEYLSSGYYKTDGSGILEVVVNTTYLTTPEIVQAVKLDFTLDFENDSQLRWIGTEHAGTGTLAEYNQTWSVWNSTTDFYIDHSFSIYEITRSTTNESDNTIIRSGDALTVTFKVQPQGGGTGLWFVPVNVSLVGSYPGVSISFFDSNGPSPNPNHDYTLGTGEIVILLTTTYGVTPKNLDIKLNATADFENDTVLNSVWYIGQKPSGGDFLSNYSYSDAEQIITVAPQYFNGSIYVPALNNPNATLIQQTETMQIEFKLKLTYLSGGDVFPDIDDVKISILINNTDPSNWEMTVTPALYQDSDDSSVIFYIETNTSIIAATPEDIYNITATADFGTTKGLTYNFTSPFPSTVPTGYLAGVWVNGTTNDNSSVTQWFEVRNINRLSVIVDDVSDPLYTDEGFISGYWEVYRETTNITLSGSYKDVTQQPVNNTEITISWNNSIGGGPFNLTNVFTDAVDGTFLVNVSLPTSTPLDDITIYARDTRVLAQEEVRIGVTNIRVVTTINLSDYSRTGSFKGNAVYVGENVSVAGTLIDDLGVIINSSELDDRLRIIGWNGSHEIGTAVIDSPDVAGTYNVSFQVPVDFTGDSLYIRLNVTPNAELIHYRINSNNISIDIYRDYLIEGLQIYLPHNSSIIPVINNSVYLINSTGVNSSGVDHQLIYVFGNLNDTAAVARRLSSKLVNTTWNGTGFSLILDTNGFFNTSYSFTGWNNVTWEWEFYHILDNGTILSKYYFITFEWEVYDISEPTITIISPVNFTTTQWLPNNDTTTFTVNVTDPSNAMGYVSVGVDNASVTIWINDTSYTMTQGTGSIFYYNWDITWEDQIYNITITAADVGGNLNSTGSFMRVIDIIVPSITPSTTQYNNSYAPVSFGGILTIEANISDSDSLTLMNSGINTSSIAIWINGTSNLMTYDIGSTYIYNWDTSTAVDKIYNITFSTYDNAGNWNVTGTYLVVLDIIEPLITSNITQYHDTYVPLTPGGNLQIVANITDSGSLTLKNSGVNTSSIAIWIDGTSFSMTQSTGSTYVYNWDTSTAVDKVYNISIGTSDNAGNWNTTGTILVVIDIIEPSIISNIIQYHNAYVDFTPGGIFQIVANITDSGSLTLKNSGVDTLTIAIWINGTSYSMTQSTGTTYVYNWDTSTAEDKVYDIKIDVSDNVGNSQTTGSIMVVLDVVGPSATLEDIDKYDSEYLRLTPEGNVAISGTINDSDSITGINSGIDNSSVRLGIRGRDTTQNVIDVPITLTAGNFTYNWEILNPEFAVWEIYLNFSDNAGNSVQFFYEGGVQLDNEAPNLDFANEVDWALPNVVQTEELTVELSINDGTPEKSGVKMTTLVVELVSNETDAIIYSKTYSDLVEGLNITETNTGASVTLDIPDENKDDVLYLRASIFDNTRNQKEIESERFSLRPISAPPLAIDLFWYILGIPLALGGGVGFAALFERLKGIRSA